MVAECSLCLLMGSSLDVGSKQLDASNTPTIYFSMFISVFFFNASLYSKCSAIYLNLVNLATIIFDE
jgi:hypothetical protein